MHVCVCCVVFDCCCNVLKLMKFMEILMWCCSRACWCGNRVSGVGRIEVVRCRYDEMILLSFVFSCNVMKWMKIHEKCVCYGWGRKW